MPMMMMAMHSSFFHDKMHTRYILKADPQVCHCRFFTNR